MHNNISQHTQCAIVPKVVALFEWRNVLHNYRNCINMAEVENHRMKTTGFVSSMEEVYV